MPDAAGPDPNAKAQKLAKIGLLLRKQGQPKDKELSMRYLASALHLQPQSAAVWKSVAHALAQDGRGHEASGEGPQIARLVRSRQARFFCGAVIETIRVASALPPHATLLQLPPPFNRVP